MKQAKMVATLVLLPCLAGCACGSGDGDKKDAGGADTLVSVPFNNDDLVEACIRLYACGVDRKVRVQDCVDNFYKNMASVGYTNLYQAMYYCANQGGGDCKVIRECMGFAGRPKDGECDKTYPSRCEGAVAHTCDLINGWSQAIDCAKGGLKCAMRDTGSASKTAVCTIDACNKDLFKPECRNNQLLTCVGGAIQMNDCGARQLQCRDPAVGLCEGTGRSCNSAQTVPMCDGSKVVDCVQNYLSEIDCSREPGQKKCTANTNPIGCTGLGSECDTGGQTTFDDCSGDNLIVCIDGFKRGFDCKKMGFVGCEKAATYGANCKAEPVYE